ncbi:hypothetical protein GUITHDRAFT_155608 [Guillardia theta CCMP2712]|uniref:Uncharacterized protein n=1 Tax=Guillardia theta (strain CCMP2712) TaxID=905079 RepID=L1IGD1_GUITC|nr:hypothetical protein GUITHDRAFT_155608 [Guillardia theta CCMP2712]EKX34989.1 hypothetical protein GUITHDRAFT_155608 [Guillardia theta CCMP2712]|eukprot:XP_005821969.1 hypothetical protein GUITHDRAFT_155608 [Guillardia theta CCMP2712]
MQTSGARLASLLEDRKHSFTYEYFHGPQLAQKPSEHDRDMSHVVKSITYGDLWGGKDQKTAISSGPPSWLTTAYEGLVHFH